MKKVTAILGLVLLPLVLARASSNVDPDHAFAWNENTGWMNFRDADATAGGVVVTLDYLAGFIWAENIGWINVGDGTPANGTHYANVNGLDFGVNLDAEGSFQGFAWSENTGWLNFSPAGLDDAFRARYDTCQRRFRGFAWGENIGWLNLDDVARFVAVGPCGAGDADCDGLLSFGDHRFFVLNFDGPDQQTQCETFDFNGDGDVDLADFTSFQRSFTGL